MTIRLLTTMIVAPALFALPFVSRGQDTTDTLRVPAFTAYSEPGMEDVNVSPEDGITGWTNAKDAVAWYGNLRSTGVLHPVVSLRMPANAASRLQLTVTPLPSTTASSDRVHPSSFLPHPSQSPILQASGGTNGATVRLDFGPMRISTPGYYRFALRGLSKSGPSFGDVDALLLSGPAAQDAHFNLRPEQRGAPSVHLSYPVPKDARVVWFYNEVTAKTGPLWSYYMACGWHRGYFGIQVNSPTERRIIFSVWDSGQEAKDRSKVADEDRVKLLAKGAGVFAGSFGNEGTGGHSHLVYPWKTGQTYRFLVSAQPDGTATIYTGWFYFPEKKQWGLIARFRAPKDGGYLRGLYSFDEDFNAANGQKKRLALFGPQWIKTQDGAWTELTSAVFTHTGKDSRTDYDAGAVGSRFYLTGGGFADGRVKYRDPVERPASAKPHPDITLPGS